jgi:ankyrin repeat protein
VGGTSALHAAAAAGHLEVVAQLVAARADLDAHDNQMESALTSALKGNFKGVSTLLLEAQAKVQAEAQAKRETGSRQGRFASGHAY